MITKEQLRHLANLSKISIPADQADKYLADMQQIIGFLDTLETETSPETKAESWSIHLFDHVDSYPQPQKMLQNTTHQLENDCIGIKTPLVH